MDKTNRPADMWQYKGKHRPDFAIEPGLGQESVWDYPRPPIMKEDTRVIDIKYKDISIAKSQRSVRVLETASPPTFYLPPDDINIEFLIENNASSFCKWKGRASYLDFQYKQHIIQSVAWCYHQPLAEFERIKDYLCFYPSKLDCFVDNIKVKPQPSDFYGGWVTPEVVGPFKGDPGTGRW